jgi:hypothetical protein
MGLVAAALAAIWLRVEARAAHSASAHHWSGGDVLTWTAPGNNRNEGVAACYDVRYSITPITSATFANATRFQATPGPSIAGSVQSCFVNRLRRGQIYYFAVKTVDRAGNWSPISNVVAKIPQEYVVGDVNGDSAIDITDIVYLTGFIFGQGQEPRPLGAGDINCDGSVSISDVVNLIQYAFDDGPEPGAACP